MENIGKINGTFMENNGNIWENQWKHMEESAKKQGKWMDNSGKFMADILVI